MVILSLTIKNMSYYGRVVSVSQFCEKPKLEKAQEFVSKGNFYWNAGIFAVGTKTISDLFLNMRNGLI